MKTLLVLSFLIIPNLLLAQSIDSLKAQIAKLEQNGYSLDLKIDSLEKERRSISNKVSELTRLISKKKFQEKLENGVPTKISFFGGKLRDKPSHLGNVIYELEKDDEVVVYDWFNDPYFKASYKGSIGYISYGSLQKNKHIQTVINKMKRGKFEQLKEENPELARLKKEYGESTAQRLMNREIWIGMSEEMAREALGYPNDINRSTGSWGVHEQWVYSNGTYLYFENGNLTSWQE